MAELLIATVILGLGLLIASSMFPVGWMKARDVAESSLVATCTEQAKQTVKMLTKRARENPAAPGNPLGASSSFFGDFGREVLATGMPIPPDALVHPVDMYNVLADPANTTNTDRRGNLPGANQIFGGEELYLLEPPHDQQLAIQAQIAFEDRVYPPLPPEPRTVASGNAYQSDEEITRWRAMLDTRRYCWGVFARLNNDSIDINKPHPFTEYYVTLKRAQPTFRFARQDKEGVGGVPLTQSPQARPAAEDMLFPVPWRIEMQVSVNHGANLNRTDKCGDGFPRAEPTEIPSQAFVQPFAGLTWTPEQGEFIVSMFAPGAMFIDERNGSVYRVVQRTLVDNDGDGIEENAVLTLDQEINVTDVDDLCADGLFNQGRDEDFRVVWVYPPPVEPRADPGDPLLPAGKPPVVGIEKGVLMLQPS